MNYTHHSVLSCFILKPGACDQSASFAVAAVCGLWLVSISLTIYVTNLTLFFSLIIFLEKIYKCHYMQGLQQRCYMSYEETVAQHLKLSDYSNPLTLIEY